MYPVSVTQTLRAVLKRGALVAAANWPVALIQSVADGLFKLVIAAPLIGGVLLVTIVIGADTEALNTLDWRVIAAGLVSSLLAHRVILVAFLLSLALVIVGGSLFVFLIKGGTVGVLVRGDRQTGAGSSLPPGVIDRAAAFSIELFIDSARTLFPRYARLGFVLMAIYLGSGGAYFAVVATRASGESWWVATLVIVVFVLWTTLVNLLYLLVQIVIAADDCGVAAAARRVLAFVRHERRLVIGVFGVVLAMVALATGASLLAFTALGLIFLVPLAWLAAVPLQLVALVLRAIVFQYIGLSSIGAYLTLYRRFSERTAEGNPLPIPVVQGDRMLDGSEPSTNPS
ncbi:MAG TPA: hypothetical protein VFV95_06380 [Vicinamibacterales bacterium]|nr:hypothetical protein [Vicinamibacterales bacterium]